MIKGSFNGLYTFKEASKIYNLNESFLRKLVFRQKLEIGVDIKKFGKTWLITEQAIIKYFGYEKLKVHRLNLNNMNYIKTNEKSKIKSKSKKLKKKDDSIISLDEQKEEKIYDDCWGEVKGTELKSFSF